MHNVTYVITDDLISFYYEGRAYLVERDGTRLDKELVDELLSVNAQALANSLFIKAHSLPKQTDGLFSYESGKYFYLSEELPLSFGERLFELIENRLPVTPLVNFWNKLKQNADEDIRHHLPVVVGNESIPLTWEGNIVTYKRASWNKPNLEVQFNAADIMLGKQAMAWGDPFAPGVRVAGDELMVGSLDWILSHCPDQGDIFDLEVQPQHVLSIPGNVKTAQMYVSEYVNISKLGSRRSDVQITTDPLVFLKTKTDVLGNTVVVREAYSLAALQDYFATLYAAPSAVKKRQSGISVQLTGSC